MNTQDKFIQLNARVFFAGKIHLLTGLHIGGTQGGIDIGGVDLTIVRNPFTREPYIPGSSIKGKLRSLLEKAYGLPQNQSLGEVHIHVCKKNAKDYLSCPVCPIFGVPAETALGIATPTRLVARDGHLTAKSRDDLQNMKLDTEFGEIKTEVVIDRITSYAMPRSQERVPAGAEFDFDLVFNLYSSKTGGDPSRDDGELLKLLVEAMQLLEGDFLGGQGSRGSGKIEFRHLRIVLENIRTKQRAEVAKDKSLADIAKLEWLPDIKKQLLAA